MRDLVLRAEAQLYVRVDSFISRRLAAAALVAAVACGGDVVNSALGDAGADGPDGSLLRALKEVRDLSQRGGSVTADGPFCAA